LLDVVLQGLVELAAWPVERLWTRIRRGADRRGGVARGLVYLAGGLAIVFVYLAALAVLIAIFYAIAYVVID
jgi:hypothetical protein